MTESTPAPTFKISGVIKLFNKVFIIIIIRHVNKIFLYFWNKSPKFISFLLNKRDIKLSEKTKENMLK